MITRLFIDNFYKHKGVTFDFNEGLTGIIGPNESGKSLIQEAIRYALFGSAALRSTAPKDLHVELTFVINGTEHLVVRKAGKARLDDQAVGTKPVNEAIIKILGYDLEVFDVANSCNQGDVEALSNMKPTARKAMIDRTVGLDVLDTAMEYCGKRGNALKSEAMGMRMALVEPEAPEIPEGLLAADDLQLMVNQKQAEAREHSQLQGFLSNAVAEPSTPRGRTAEVLKLLRAEAAADVVEFNQLQGFLARAPSKPIYPDMRVWTYDVQAQHDERIRALAQNKAFTQQRSMTPAEEFTAAELDARGGHLTQWDQWQERVRLLAQGHHCCPSCNHSWPIADGIPDVVEVTAPLMSRAELGRHRTRTGNNVLLASWIDLPVPEDCSDDLAQLLADEAALSAYERALEAFNRYNEGLQAKVDRFAELTGAVAHEAVLSEEYTGALNWRRYDDFEAEAAPKRLRATLLVNAEVERQALQIQLDEARRVEALQAAYVKARAVYDAQVGVHVALAAKSEVFLKARMDMADLKSRVKSHLLPSLNKVASSLLNEMTGGARYQVEVDEDFEILIDGMPVNTLSGSGKAVANLAIRLALGRILTNRMFSLFMADEVDGSMDEDRADYVALALRRLTGMVKQVILITHKRPEVDHTIELNK